MLMERELNERKLRNLGGASDWRNAFGISGVTPSRVIRFS